MDDFPDIPAFLRLTAEQREAGWAGHTPRPSAPFIPAKVVDATTAAFVAEQERDRKIKTENRIARMLTKKETHVGERWNVRTGRWEARA